MNREQVLGIAPISAAGLRTPRSWRVRSAFRRSSACTTRRENLETGEHVLLDGYNGLLIVNPSDETLREYGELERQEGDDRGTADAAARNQIDHRATAATSFSRRTSSCRTTWTRCSPTAPKASGFTARNFST